MPAEDEDVPQIEESKLNPIPYAIRDLLGSIVKPAPVPPTQPFFAEDQPKSAPIPMNPDRIQSFWDIHQHSKKKNIFIYGPYYPLHQDKYLKIRLIPKLLGDRTEMFRYYSCRFRLEKYKESCARLTINRQFHIANSFTLECSSFGYFSRDTRLTQ